MKLLRTIVCALLIIACLALLGYQYFTYGSLEARLIIKMAGIIAAAVLSMAHAPKAKMIAKKDTYAKVYSEYIQNAFHDSPKLERQFYNAVHLYNLNKLEKAIRKLEKLKNECESANELRCVTIFIALCLDDLKLFDKAIAQYQSALSIRNSSSLCSNMGLCYQRTGDFVKAQDCYQQAIQLNPKNAYALNNLSALYFRLGNYDEALDVAAEAIAVDGKMRQAFTTAAICCSVLGYEEEYQQYYRQAVSNGADGKKIKQIIKNMDTSI